MVLWTYPEAYSETCQASGEMVHIAKLVGSI